VVGEVHRCRRIRHGGQRDRERVVPHLEADRGVQVARISLFTVGRAIGEDGATAGRLEHAPHALAEAEVSAVQVVRAFVGGDLVRLALEREASVRDAVAEAADDRPDVRAVRHVVREPRQREDAVTAFAADRE
jgi:hypothetical protein